MTDYNERAERIAEWYNDRIADIENAMYDLRVEKAQVTVERGEQLDALEREWAAEHGFPVGARVDVDFDGYLAWRKAQGYTVPALIKPGAPLLVSSVTREGRVLVQGRRGDEGELLLGTAIVPAQFVTVIEEGE